MKHIDFFHGIFKTVILVALVLVIGLVMVRLYFAPTPSQSSKIPIITVKPTDIVTIKTDPTQPVFNLMGPLKCEYTTPDASVSAYILNKNIKIQSAGDTNNYSLVKGDCFYQWITPGKNGTKTCGITSLLNTAEAFFNMGMLNMGMLNMGMLNMGMLNTGGMVDIVGKNVLKSDKITPTSNTNEVLTSLLSNCKEASVEAQMFDLPSKIIFKESTPSSEVQM